VGAEMNGIEYGPHANQLFIRFEEWGKGLEISETGIALDQEFRAVNLRKLIDNS
jgi:hypothetical protein